MAYRLKVANSYPVQSHKSPSLVVTPFEFRDEPDICKNYRVFRLSVSEEIMTLALFVLIQYRSVIAGQTDGPSDISAPTVQH